MPKIPVKVYQMYVELVFPDGSTFSEVYPPVKARELFTFFVKDCCCRFSRIKEVNLYDYRHRLMKSFKQFF